MARTHCRGCGDPVWWAGTETHSRPIMLDATSDPDGAALLVGTDRGVRVRLLSYAEATALRTIAPRYRVHATRCPALRAGVA